jgi:hypothetical protein
MATTIITKNGSGAPAVGDLVQGELAVDLTNKTLYSKDSSGNVFKVGDTGGGSPGTFTDLVATDSFTSPGIDDNATSTTITIDANENVGIGTGITSPTYQVDIYDGTGTQNIFRARQAGSTNGFTIKGEGSEYNYQMLDGDLEVIRSGTTGISSIEMGGATVDNARRGGFFKNLETFDMTYNNQLNPGVAVGKHIFKNGSDTHMVIDSSGNVGIGTATPNAPLDVEGVSGVVMGRYYDGVGTASLKFTTNSNNEVGLAHAGVASGGLTFATGSGAVGTERMRIDSTGNVGINKTNPQSTLDVNGTFRTTSGSTRYVIDASPSGSGYEALVTMTDDGLETTLNSTSRGFIWTNGNGEKMRIDNAGNVGIGTSAPVSYQQGPALNIGDTGDSYAQLNFTTATNGIQYIGFGDTTSGTGRYQGLISFDHNTDSMGFGTNASTTQNMLIDSSGNVGIGTSSPMEDLAIRATNSQAGFSLAAATTQCFLRYNNYFSGSTQVSDASKGSASIGLGKGSDGVITLNTAAAGAGSPTERLRIDNTGNVGIGTSSPVNTSGYGGLTLNGVSGGSLSFTDDDVLVGNLLSSGTDMYFQTGGDTIFRNGGYASSDEAMRIDSSGNLLVGRTSASAAATDHGWQAYNTGIVYQYADAATSTDVHRWYNGAGSLVASINARGEGFFLGGATYSGPLKADEIIQDGAPVVDSLQIIRAFMKLRAATADPDSTVEELREKLKTAVDDIIDQFQDQIDNMPTPLED